MKKFLVITSLTFATFCGIYIMDVLCWKSENAAMENVTHIAIGVMVCGFAGMLYLAAVYNSQRFSGKFYPVGRDVAKDIATVGNILMATSILLIIAVVSEHFKIWNAVDLAKFARQYWQQIALTFVGFSLAYTKFNEGLKFSVASMTVAATSALACWTFLGYFRQW